MSVLVYYGSVATFVFLGNYADPIIKYLPEIRVAQSHYCQAKLVLYNRHAVLYQFSYVHQLENIGI